MIPVSVSRISGSDSSVQEPKPDIKAEKIAGQADLPEESFEPGAGTILAAEGEVMTISNKSKIAGKVMLLARSSKGIDQKRVDATRLLLQEGRYSVEMPVLAAAIITGEIG